MIPVVPRSQAGHWQGARQRLRPAQLKAMEAVLAGRDVLAVMATGSGKSAIYQVPGVLLDGVTLVVSPLIALQRDQISGLAATKAPDAVAINSLLASDENDRVREAVRRPGHVEPGTQSAAQLALIGVGEEGLHAPEHGLETRRQHPVECLFGHFLDRLVDQHRGIVDHRPQRPG